MGGFGSGWCGPRKAAVEDGLTLSISTLLDKHALIPGGHSSGSWIWFYPGHEPHARIRYEAYLGDTGEGWLDLRYSVNGTPVNSRIDLVTTRPTYGGFRWWFLCPLERKNGGIPCRMAILHLPPGKLYFRSRQAYGLTYRSCRESGKYNGLFRRIAADMGTDPAIVRRALKRW